MPAAAGAPDTALSGRVRGHGPDGRFQRGNREALRHGLYASALAEALAAEREAFLTASLVDDGGEADLPIRRRSLHAYRARLHVHIGQISDAVERFGLFDGRAQLRSAWLQRLEGLIARAQAIDATLGLARQCRPLPSARDIIAEYDRRAQEAQ